jgi:hypothetical protein
MVTTMRNAIRSTVLLAASLALAGCVAKYDVRTDVDPAIDFAQYRSFAIPPRPTADTPDILDNSLVRKRLERLFAQHLAERGLVHAPEQDPADLLVRYWVTTVQKTDITTVPAAGAMVAPYPYGAYGYPGPYWGGRWGSMYQDVIVRDYTEGTLVLDLVDRKRDELVWRAYVVGTLSHERETMYQLVDEALARAFKDFPSQRRDASPFP